MKESYLLRVGELEVAGLPGDDRTLMLGNEPGSKLCLETAGLLGVQVTLLLRNINQGGDGLVMTLLGAFLSDAASTANLNGKLLAASITFEMFALVLCHCDNSFLVVLTNKLAGLLLNITSGAGRFIHSSALLGSLSVADLVQWPVAFLNSLVGGLLSEDDLAPLLKVLLANLLLGRLKGGDIGVVALLIVLVRALEDGILLHREDSLLLLNATKAGLGVILAPSEVNSTSHLKNTLLVRQPCNKFHNDLQGERAPCPPACLVWQSCCHQRQRQGCGSRK